MNTIATSADGAEENGVDCGRTSYQKLECVTHRAEVSADVDRVRNEE